MEVITSKILGVKEKVLNELRYILVSKPHWETTALTPASLGIIRGELMKEVGKRQPGDAVVWIAGKSVAAELDEAFRESRGEWTHPVVSFYDHATELALRDTGYLGMLCGYDVIADDTGFIFPDMFMCVLIRDDVLVSAVGRFITPYNDGLNNVVVHPTTFAAGQASLKELMDQPDPMIEDNFDICSVSAEESVARAIGLMTAKNPQFMALVEFKLTLDFGKRDLYELAGLKLPAYRLEAGFHDLDFDQEQLDARAALVSSKLSQLVIRQFKMDGSVARYLVLSDLRPETVNIQHNATGCAVARRTASWLFMSMTERKEFPGEL